LWDGDAADVEGVVLWIESDGECLALGGVEGEAEVAPAKTSEVTVA
jgi:hypothetical protein